MSVGLLLLRLVVGLTLAAHGTQKLFGWFEGPGLEGAGKFMESLGFRPGRLNALAAGVTEVGAGLALAVGLATPLAAAAVVGVMVVAGSASFAKGYFAQKGGYEYTVVLGTAALTLAFTGPGALSLDALLGYALPDLRLAVGALGVGLVAGAGRLLTRSATSSSLG